jgi:ABC-type uncharacterized transport system substrate-binding protein
LEQQNVSLIYAMTTGHHYVSRYNKTPIVFSIGSDPVTGGLVDSFPSPAAGSPEFITRSATSLRSDSKF